MDISINETSETRREVTVTFSADDLSREEKSILREFANQAKIPGFRPGKAPESILRKRFGKEIREELNRKILRAGYEKMQKDGGFEVLNMTDVKDPDLDGDAPYEMVLTVDIKPAFELPEYKGIALERDPLDVTDEEIEQALEHTRAQHAEFNKVERPADKTDYVKCSYEGKIDGESIAEHVSDRPMYGTQNGTWEEAGAEEAPGISEIATALVGMAEGDKKSVEVTFPDEHEVEFLRGKTVSYDLEVLEVRERKLPELTEDFLKTLNVESVEQLREQITESLRGQKEQAGEGQLRQAASQRLADLVDFPLPESLVASETSRILTNHMGRQMQMGVTEEDLEKNREALYAGAGEEARKKVKIDLLLDEIANAEKVEVTEDDMGNFLYSYAMQTRRNPEDIVKELRKDRGRVAEIQRNIRRSKTVARVVELAEVSETGATAAAAS